MKLIVLVIALALAAPGCGQNSSGGTTTADVSAVTGVFLEHPSTNPEAGTPVAGATIGVYTRPISTAGPVMADPPSPIARVKTAADGTFTVHVTGRTRVFLAPIGAQPYTTGKWAQVGGPPVTLTGCTDCVRPL